MSHAIERIRQERYRAFIEHPRSERDMAEASRRGRLLQSEPEKPLPADVPLCERGFGVMDADGS
jgi:hypothetical protein